MTQSEETPAQPPTTETQQAAPPAEPDPIPEQRTPEEAAPPAEPDPIPEQRTPAEAALPAEPDPIPAQATQSLPPVSAPIEFAVTATDFGAPGALEQAPAEAGTSNRRTLLAKSAALAVPAIALVGLLVVTGLQVSSLSAKTSAASTAAKAATSAGPLADQLRAAQSAAQASILVDAGCVATESDATATAITNLSTATNALLTAEKGDNLGAFLSAAEKYINSLQTFSTDLQQDAALSHRTSVTSAITAVVNDLHVVISAMQGALAGDFSTSTQHSLDAAATRVDGDTTAVDTLCGGHTLSASSSSSGGNGVIA